ncbi:juvenile hormone epoxide hydrolase-like [Choristoneura fumiferana]|uniref:juvenile hormone epoxide hydrolase-like n=1 Tax=Choristoneura fumiferana TaxID=7141 RepID=UPI003D15EFF2
MAGKRKNKTSFRAVLEVASNLVGSFFPQRHLPRVPERWWGDEHRERDTRIRPFRVEFSDEMITDLRARIHNRRNITHALRGAAHAYGTNADYLNHFLDFWANDYDFKKREDWLNRFPQYVTNIQGLDIHFMHIRPPNPHQKLVLPLLMLHGWPVTAFEFVHVIDNLLSEREDCDFVFEMIVPDLPGYGYSEGTSKIGLSQYQMAIIMKNLMRRLGKPRFYIHAGDIGQFVADSMAVLFPDRVLGLHTNFAFSLRPETLVKYVLGQLYPSAVEEPRYQNRMYPLADFARFYAENTGYLHLHASRPDNVGHGLEDSPVAQASWLIQNIILATRPRDLLVPNGNLPQHYHMSDLFDSFTVYWAAQCMATSIRSYAETLAWFQDPLTAVILMTPTRVPFAAIRFRHELIYQPDSFLRDKYPNLVQALTMDFGGHFAGYEEPAALADSIWTAVKKMEAFTTRKDITEGLLV